MIRKNTRGQVGGSSIGGDDGLTGLVAVIAVSLILVAFIMPIGIGFFAEEDVGVSHNYMSVQALEAGESADVPENIRITADSVDAANDTSTVTVTYIPTGDSVTQTFTASGESLAINDYDTRQNPTSTYQATLANANDVQISQGVTDDLDRDGTDEVGYNYAYYSEISEETRSMWDTIPVIMLLAIILGAIAVAVNRL